MRYAEWSEVSKPSGQLSDCVQELIAEAEADGDSERIQELEAIRQEAPSILG